MSNLTENNLTDLTMAAQVAADQGLRPATTAQIATLARLLAENGERADTSRPLTVAAASRSISALRDEAALTPSAAAQAAVDAGRAMMAEHERRLAELAAMPRCSCCGERSNSITDDGCEYCA